MGESDKDEAGLDEKTEFEAIEPNFPAQEVIEREPEKLSESKDSKKDIITFIKIALVSEIASWVQVIAGAIIFAILFNNLIIVNAMVPTGSMVETIQEKSRIVAFRLAYAFSEPERFDIIVFEYPDNPPEDPPVLFVKRVIGLPGDTVNVVDGKVYINDSEVPLDDEFTKKVPKEDHSNSGPFVVPEGCYFVMGDNRTNSHDSRAWTNKYVPKEKILGEVIFSYWPSFKIIKN